MGDFQYLRLTLRQSTVEVVWGDEKSQEEIVNPIPIIRLKEYRESWRSLASRVLALSPLDFRRSFQELDLLLTKKSLLLSDLLGFLPSSSLTKLIVISDSGIPELPYEILPYKSGYLVDQVLISRNVRRYRKPSFQKKTEQILYVTHTESKAVLKDSLDREEENLSKILKRIKSPLMILKDRVMRPPRFMEELLVSKYFIYCGHLDPASIPFPSDASISSDEIAKMDLSQLKIAFLNGCSGFQTLDNELSLAQGFLTAGTEIIIGFSEPVTTKDAERASVIFWKKFAETQNVDLAYLACLQEWKSKKSWNRFIFARMGQIQDKKNDILLVTRKTFIWTSIFTLFLFSVYYFEVLSPSAIIKNEKQTFVESTTSFKEEPFKMKKIQRIEKRKPKKLIEQTTVESPVKKTEEVQKTLVLPLIEKLASPNSVVLKETQNEIYEIEISAMIEKTSDSTLKRNLHSFISGTLDAEEKKYRVLKTKEILSNYKGAREIRIEMMKYFGSSFETH